MNLQTQLIDNCGQCALAMLVGCSQYEAMTAVGKDHGTTVSMLSAALFQFGFEVETVRFARKNWPPKLALAVMRSKTDESYGHVVLVRDGTVIDPNWGQPVDAEDYLRASLATGKHFTSLIIVKGRRL